MTDRDDMTGPHRVPARAATPSGEMWLQIGRLAEAVERNTEEVSGMRRDFAQLPCRGQPTCPTPPKRPSSEQPKVPPKPEIATAGIGDVIDWMDRLSAARAKQFKRWAVLGGSLIASAALWTGWRSCDVEGRLAALARRPAQVQPVAVPQPIVVGPSDARR